MSRTPAIASSAEGRWARAAVGAALLALGAAIAASAWLCDDAYITFRTVDNFVNGDGLRWNVAERVQSYTHPLWMFAIAGLYLPTGDIYYSSLGLSLVCSLAALAILAYHIAASPRLALLALLPLLLSKSFIDYSTSGLENPLSHLLLALFFMSLVGDSQEGAEPAARRALRLGFITALIGLNRLDALLLIAPALLYFLSSDGRWRAGRVLGALALGGLPLVFWEIFSLFYYGFPFPNTAYAKLATGVPAADLALQGLRYLADSLYRDPITLAATVAGAIVGLGARASTASGARSVGPAISIGIVLYLLYVVRIGGDFMSGRLLAAPLFCAALLLCTTQLLSGRRYGGALTLILALALAAGLPTLTSVDAYSSAKGSETGAANRGARWHGIADERAVYYPETGLLRRWLGLARVEDHERARHGLAAREGGLDWTQGQALGFFGFYAGPRVHILDMVGLCDPLLARLDARIPWRIGHFERRLPRGYVDTLRSGSNQITDPDLAAYYDVLARVTRAPLFDTGRLASIAAMNLTTLDGRLARYRARHSSDPR